MFLRHTAHQSNEMNACVASVVSGPADYTNGYLCTQSVSVSFVCVSAQQSEEMSVSGEELDEHTPETKRLATGNTQQVTDKASCPLQLLGPRSHYVKHPLHATDLVSERSEGSALHFSCRTPS